MLKNVIVDGDFGGDEMQLLSVLLSRPEKFKVLGVTAVHGNTNHDQVLENAGSILRLLNADEIVPRYAGAKTPSDNEILEGDNAHGDDGVGGIKLEKSNVLPAQGHAVDFILEQLKTHPPHTVSITATGPLTNIALAIQKDPATMQRIKEIVIMGGCTESMPAHDMPVRQGNITPHAEFNFYMAPKDAGMVMNSGLPLTLFPMNCTHQLTFTPERQEKLAQTLASRPEARDQIIGMMKAAEWLDKMKFDSFNVMHDIHTALYLNDSSQYAGKNGFVEITTGKENPEKGKSRFSPLENGSVKVMHKILNPDHLFDVFSQGVSRILSTNQPLSKPAAGPSF